jgi:hypothetical protein
MKFMTQAIVYTYIFIFNLTSIASPAQAALIGADEVIAAQSRNAAEYKIQAALARDDVATAMQKLGVSPQQVHDRVAALSDDEVNTLAQKMDHLPAGGDFFATVGVIFVILLITDVLGFTKVFPFTRAQR